MHALSIHTHTKELHKIPKSFKLGSWKWIGFKEVMGHLITCPQNRKNLEWVVSGYIGHT